MLQELCLFYVHATFIHAQKWKQRKQRFSLADCLTSFQLLMRFSLQHYILLNPFIKFVRAILGLKVFLQWQVL